MGSYYGPSAGRKETFNRRDFNLPGSKSIASFYMDDFPISMLYEIALSPKTAEIAEPIAMLVMVVNCKRIAQILGRHGCGKNCGRYFKAR